MTYAHSGNPAGEWHDLTGHLRTVAAEAEGFAAAFGAAEPARWLGLWHDLGKFNPAFQRYLLESAQGATKRGRGPDHKAAGAELCKQHFGLLALAVQGHHGGLKSPTQFQTWLADRLKDGAAKEALELARRELPDLDPTGPSALPEHVMKDARASEFFTRMLFSALVDADHLDTERHFQGEKADQRGPAADLHELWARFERRQRAVAGNAEGEVNRVRREVYEACLQAAENAPGLYRLTVPTGGGKTLSGMAFALRHALRHGLRRVVVAVPYISITEQTAKVYRDAFAGEHDDPSGVVLEHHSGVGGDRDEEGDFRPERQWARLAAENWDAPVVVTTTVQLFESLFASGTGPTRKLHRLAGSVLILDEAQALPSHLLAPALDALRELCAHYNSSVVLSTATQPAFEEIPVFAQAQATEIVPDPARHFAAPKRVEYEWRTERPMEWADVAELMRGERQALAVLNTKADALALLDALGDSAALHLSTSLCGAHRRAVIEDVRERLKAGQACRLVSTQVVEAGVDLDFPLVLRALGPLDGIIQAAGRCNREGRLERGRVVVFQPAKGGLPPGAYRAAAQETRTMLGRGQPNLDDPATVREYFRALFQVSSPDARGIQGLRERLDYPEVASRFRMIEEETEGAVVLAYGTEAQRARVRRDLEELRRDPGSARRVLRRLQPYVVAVRSRQAEEYRQQSLLLPVLEGLEVGEWHGAYDPVRGLLARDRGPEGLIA